MSEQRFRLDYEEDDAIFIVEDDDIVYPIRNDTIKEFELQNLVDKLNEQQATIRKLQDLCGESDGENAKLRIENKKLKEERQRLIYHLNKEPKR